MRAVISCVAGTFFLSDGKERFKIPVEYTLSKEVLSDWAEESYEEVLYNFPDSCFRSSPIEGRESVSPSHSAMDDIEELKKRNDERQHRIASAHYRGFQSLADRDNVARIKSAEPLPEKKVEKVEKKCEFCATDFLVLPCENFRRYCSTDCASQVRRKGKKRKCWLCQHNYISHSPKTKNYENTDPFCSTACRFKFSFSKESP